VVDRPITSGYRNDATRIDCRGRFIGGATGLTPLEQDLGSALAAIPSDYGRGLPYGSSA